MKLHCDATQEYKRQTQLRRDVGAVRIRELDFPYKRNSLFKLRKAFCVGHCRHSMRLKVIDFIGCQMMGLRLRRSVM